MSISAQSQWPRSGVPTAHTEIADFNEKRTLIVERINRLWTKDSRLLRVPLEDICQALYVAPSRKYQSDGGPGVRDIIELLKGSDTPDDDIATFMRACIIFWMFGATDGHAKNSAQRLAQAGTFAQPRFMTS
ncbi:HipA domain-containing protein [Brucella intermedia]|uniref:HipA domain-containing protein n=1 Tax=Brucella intermedia TaxID=94625 RepID=UPI00200059D5|nr:HipA domain-containing protein [Brucella intermedia]